MRFECLCPRSLEEAVGFLVDLRENARIFAGGTDLLPQIRQGKVFPRYLVNIKRIAGLDSIEIGCSGGLQIGALSKVEAIETSNIIRRNYHALSIAASCLGSPQVRRLATIGGNICNAAPSAELAPPLLCLDARAVIQGPSGVRVMEIGSFFKGPGMTSLGTGEILVALHIPHYMLSYTSTYLRVGRRAAMDIPTVNAAAAVEFEPETNVCLNARIALGAVAPTPIRIRSAEQTLSAGRKLTVSLIMEVAHEAAREVAPISDIRASEGYRRSLVTSLVARALSILSQGNDQFGGNTL